MSWIPFPAPFQDSQIEIGGYDLWCQERYLSPFMATQDQRLQKILPLLDLKSTDVFYDLGCGNGKVIIHTGKMGIQSVGVDFDPAQVENSLQAIKKCQVEHIVRAFQGDFLQIDLSEATVIYLFLLPAALKLLKPRLLQLFQNQLRLVVSVLYEFQDWPLPFHTESDIPAFFYPNPNLSQIN